MTGKIEYEWHLREVMAQSHLHLTTKLRPALEAHGIYLSDSQIYRLVTEKPERMNMKTLFALLMIFGCRLDDLAPSRFLAEVELRDAVGDDGRGSPSEAIRERGLRPPRVTLVHDDSAN